MSKDIYGSKFVGLTADKLEQLGRDLHDPTKKTSDGESPHDLLRIARVLFGRAPVDFLNRTTVQTLKEIVLEMHQLETQMNSDHASPYVVKVENFSKENERENCTAISVMISDRPFVVDTIAELLRVNELRTHVFLHPIHQPEGSRQIALNYLEIDRIDDPEKLEKLKHDLEVSLADLTLITDDFTPMLVRVETSARLIESGFGSQDFRKEDQRETGNFLRWLADNSFVFLGYREWKVSTVGGDGANGTMQPIIDADLGLFRSKNEEYVMSLDDAQRDALHVLEHKKLLHVSRILLESNVHRRIRMDLITVQVPSADGQTKTFHSYLGLLTSKALSQEASSTPLIRRKLEQVIAMERAQPNTFDYKEIVSFVDGTPKSELLQADVTTLQKDIDLIMNMMSLDQSNEVRISARMDELFRSISLMVVLPRERFGQGTRQRIQEFLEKEFEVTTGSSEYRLAFSDDPLVRIYFFIPNATFAPVQIDLSELESQITELTVTWDDNLFSVLSVKHGDTSAGRLTAFYSRALPEQYKAATSPQEAGFDVSMLELLTPTNLQEIAIRKSDSEDDEDLADLKIYKRGKYITLSSILPYLENSGLEIVNETVTRVKTQDDLESSIYNFQVKTESGRSLDFKIAQSFYLPALKKIFEGEAENDALNALLLDPGMSVEDLAIIRTLQHFLWQLKVFDTGRRFLIAAVVSHPNLSELLIQYFMTKFDPDQFVNDLPGRIRELEKIKSAFVDGLRRVSNLQHDRILRALLNLVDATVRTNFFQHSDDNKLALKIDCAKIEKMPIPRPMYEIFVCAPQFEGVHLRGGKVARGGLRWSERQEDFRTEVLGLMKTQMVKNSIIVPVGGKGGFVVKGEATKESVQTCYRRFIHSLLQLSDNRTETGVVQPPRTVIYDEEDPYLVVAADKGTATFSDLANQIATEEFDFWLGDAFASGGKYGYDHKKLGITARGAWEAACRHFREIGIDVETQSFSVIGIGDMSGDVFGNGLLRSDNAKLIAAFNHKHIFIDPNPDLKKSFEERERMFELPTSAWTDYNSDVISQGGGIYDRDAKEIPISPEAATALGISDEVLAGPDLVKAILRAPVDLLWNGGIGTYVKASWESDLTVGDRANDNVRIDARDLRVKVIAEGGNLGLTQFARIEYSKLGGHINIDAVDNSGGVDCSDLEVNLKILLNEPQRRGEVALDDRNKLLNALSKEVCDKVLARNRSQSKVLSLGARRSRKNIDYYRGLINDFEEQGFLSREAEFLPDDDTLIKRSSLKAGLTRPELAVVIAYVKMSLFNTIVDSNLTDEPFLRRYLFNYFPRAVVSRFPEDTISHPLAKEIIAKQVANTLVELMGATFVYRNAEETGAPQATIIASFLAAEAIVGANDLAKELDVMDRAHSTKLHLNALLAIASALDGMTRWFLEHRNENLTMAELVERYREPFRVLIKETDLFLTEFELQKFQEHFHKLRDNGFPTTLAQSIASLSYATAFLDVVDISAEQAFNVTEVAKLYANLVSEFKVSFLLEQADNIDPTDRWEALAVRTISAQLINNVARLTSSIIEETGSASLESMNDYLNRRTEVVNRFRLSLKEFQNGSMSIPAILVIANQLYGLAKQTATSEA